MHQMRTRIITSPGFNGDRILGAILFEGTMDRAIEGQPTADYLWKAKQVLPFLKVDKGLAAEKDGVQLMKPIPQLAELLTKRNPSTFSAPRCARSIKQAAPAGIDQIVQQQFELAAQIIAAGLVPIVEPEVDIRCPDKARAESLLKAAILDKLKTLPSGQLVMLKLTLPEQDNFYSDFVRHRNVVRVVALSGGYSREEANDRLYRNHGVVASFSRALLRVYPRSSPMPSSTPSRCSIQSIYEASTSEACRRSKGEGTTMQIGMIGLGRMESLSTSGRENAYP